MSPAALRLLPENRIPRVGDSVRLRTVNTNPLYHPWHGNIVASGTSVNDFCVKLRA